MAIMKKTVFIALLCVLFAGCKKEHAKDETLNITGSWHLTDLLQTDTRSVTIGQETIDVYIDFATDNTFRLYQMVGAGNYRRYSGTWTLADNKLSGIYDDKTPWGSEYNIELNSASTELTLTSAGEQYVYTKTEIPDEVLSSAR